MGIYDFSWIRQIVKMSVLPKLIYEFNIIPIQILTGFSVGANKLILKFIWKIIRFRILTILKKNTIRRLTLPNITAYSKPTAIKTAWY